MTKIKIATFNVENLFTRPAAMSSEEHGQQAIEDHAIANTIVNKDEYSEEDKQKLIELSKKYKWHVKNPPQNSLVQLQKIRGQLFKNPKSGSLEVVAKGRNSWVGGFDLLRENVKWKATYNTGRVINEIQPDILITVEVESRPTLERFNDQVLKAEFGFHYDHIMLIDGNDRRGIDVGIMSKFPIETMRSHVDDKSGTEKIFSRDCPEYDIILPNGAKLIILPNHFKSKRNFDDASIRKRELQANSAHQIALNALNRSKYVLICGDLNDTPDNLQVLFEDDFEDVNSHSDYPTDRPGTYDTGSVGNKIDYLIMSPALKTKLQTTGIERRGSYHPRTWTPFDTVTNKSEEASDHHLVWAEFRF